MPQTLHPTPHQLKTRIVDELTWTPEVGADHIGVAINDGAVTLSGEVTSYLEKTSAVRAALRVRGVTAVADEIIVRHSDGVRPDVDLARDVGAALTATPGSREVRAEVANHWITLTGEVAWHFQSRAAEQAVEAIAGVSGVRNAITITPNQVFSADRATRRIAAALQRNAALDAQHVHVSTSGSTVELSGRVGSWAELRQAGYAAWSTPGVTQVTNHLRVVS